MKTEPLASTPRPMARHRKLEDSRDLCRLSSASPTNTVRRLGRDNREYSARPLLRWLRRAGESPASSSATVRTNSLRPHLPPRLIDVLRPPPQFPTAWLAAEPEA